MTDCDVAVVGAGVIGEVVAYELSIRGASVTLLDARGSGLGSTQAAAGMLVPFIEGLGRPLLRKRRRDRRENQRRGHEADGAARDLHFAVAKATLVTPASLQMLRTLTTFL